MQGEFAFRLQLLDRLVLGNAERNAELAERQGDFAVHLPLAVDIRRKQLHQTGGHRQGSVSFS